jgi:hypothetical protein
MYRKAVQIRSHFLLDPTAAARTRPPFASTSSQACLAVQAALIDRGVDGTVSNNGVRQVLASR